MRSQYDRFALPAIALLCVTGAAWSSAQLARRIGPRAASSLVAAAAALLFWSALANRPQPAAERVEPDYRAEMFRWIVRHVPPTATLVFESDTLPLLQTVYDPGAQGQPFQVALQKAFERAHPRLPTIVKTQFIGAVYNYDPKLLTRGRVFFLSSSQNRDYIAAHRTELREPAAFYEALDRTAAVVHETGGFHEKLVLYVTGDR